MDEKFSTVKRGYAKEEVDRYIASLEAELATLKEQKDLIASAIIRSEETSLQIIAKAHEEAVTIKKESQAHLLDLEKKIKHMRMKLDSFQSGYNQLMHKYFITTNNEDFGDLYHSLDKISDLISPNDTPSSTSPIVEKQYEKVSTDY